MKAPVKMTCSRCGGQIALGAEIERTSKAGQAAKYAHIGCTAGNPQSAPASVPKVDPKPADTPKGWVTEDSYALPADALKRLHGQQAPDEIDNKAARSGNDDRVDKPDEGDAPDIFDDIGDGEGSGDSEGTGEQEGDDGEGDKSGDSEGDQEGSTEGDGDEEGEDGEDGEESGEGESEGDGDEEGGDKEGEREGEEGSGEDEGEDDGEQEDDKPKDAKKEQPKKQEQKRPDREPAKPKEKSGRLEDLPDDLLLRLATLAAQMAEKRIKGGIESRLAKMLADAAEPLVGKMASEFQHRMGDSVRSELEKAIGDTRKQSDQMVRALQKEIDKRVADEIKRLDGLRPVVHKIERADGSAFEFPKEELFHFAFDEVLKLSGAGMDGFLPGPTGCGKTHLMEQVSKALGLDFAMVSGTGGTTETEILGNSSPNITTGENVYQETGFVRVYENGGLFLLDEADAMDANALLKVNAAIANGFCPVPKRSAKPVARRHPNFIFWMAANTWGHGATRMYCGRNKLDEATLDRVRAATVPMDYDPNVERRLVEDQPLYRILADWRAKIMEHNLPRVLSTRFMIHSRKLKALGYDVRGIAAKLTGGWTAGERAKVTGFAV